MRHGEFHRTEHIGWLRAAVLGANDGLISTSSLIVASLPPPPDARRSCWPAWPARGGACRWPPRVRLVSSQSDTERRPRTRTPRARGRSRGRARGADAASTCRAGSRRELAVQVADSDRARCARRPRARRAGLSEATRARPVQAGLSSALAFAVGAAHLLIAALAPMPAITLAVSLSSLLLLIALAPPREARGASMAVGAPA